MLHLALPHINVLSKIDLAETFGTLHFGLDFYTEVMDLERLVFGASEERSIQSLLACAVGAEFQDDVVGAAAERYVPTDEGMETG